MRLPMTEPFGMMWNQGLPNPGEAANTQDRFHIT